MPDVQRILSDVLARPTSVAVYETGGRFEFDRKFTFELPPAQIAALASQMRTEVEPPPARRKRRENDEDDGPF